MSPSRDARAGVKVAVALGLVFAAFVLADPGSAIMVTENMQRVEYAMPLSGTYEYTPEPCNEVELPVECPIVSGGISNEGTTRVEVRLGPGAPPIAATASVGYFAVLWRTDEQPVCVGRLLPDGDAHGVVAIVDGDYRGWMLAIYAAASCDPDEGRYLYHVRLGTDRRGSLAGGDVFFPGFGDDNEGAVLHLLQRDTGLGVEVWYRGANLWDGVDALHRCAWLVRDTDRAAVYDTHPALCRSEWLERGPERSQSPGVMLSERSLSDYARAIVSIEARGQVGEQPSGLILLEVTIPR